MPGFYPANINAAKLISAKSKSNDPDIVKSAQGSEHILTYNQALRH